MPNQVYQTLYLKAAFIKVALIFMSIKEFLESSLEKLRLIYNGKNAYCEILI